MNSHEFNRYIIERQNGMYDILESSDIVMEFFKLKKKEKLPVYNGDYGNPVSEEEKKWNGRRIWKICRKSYKRG